MSKRPLPSVDTRAVVERLGHCRDAMVELSAGSPPRSLSRASADQMIRNIDELAWVLTGDRDYFVTSGHGPNLYAKPS
ncbi:MAG: hypothetical protein AAGB11_14185 [Pseudomonadota bacterium]